MTHEDKLNIFKAQTQNVRELLVAETHLNRSINHALRSNNCSSAKMHTKVLSLIFCAWSEANFSKLIHTPHGLPIKLIEEVKRIHKTNGLGAGWKKAVELSSKRIKTSCRSNYIPNISKKLCEVIDIYVVEPSLIRNKIAHGQWNTALNRNNTAINNELSKQIENLNVVTLIKWFTAHERLSNVVEALIESPNKAFQRDYWKEISNLEDFLKKSSKWNIEDKIKLLKRKALKRS